MASRFKVSRSEDSRIDNQADGRNYGATIRSLGVDDEQEVGDRFNRGKWHLFSNWISYEITYLIIGVTVFTLLWVKLMKFM